MSINTAFSMAALFAGPLSSRLHYSIVRGACKAVSVGASVGNDDVIATSDQRRRQVHLSFIERLNYVVQWSVQRANNNNNNNNNKQTNKNTMFGAADRFVWFYRTLVFSVIYRDILNRQHHIRANHRLLCSLG